MDAKTKTQRVHVLMTRYLDLYKEVHKIKPPFNRNTLKWGFTDMFDDLGIDALPVLEYYFTLKRDHSVRDLLRHYDEFQQWMIEDEEDAVNRKKLREKTKQKVEEHNQQWQQPST
jgi:hypothetical protein